MTRYRIVYWKEIPSMVVVEQDGHEIKTQLSARFQAAIDAYAMAAGLTGTEEYLAGWKRGPWQERDGTPAEVSRDVVAELEVQFKKIEFPKKDNER